MLDGDKIPVGRGPAAEILARYRQIYRASREGESLLRYNRRTVPVSSIAQQFYCEKAVQYSIEQPRAPSREMLAGIAGHQAVASQAVVLSPEQAVAEAVAPREEPICIYEFRIGWQHAGVTVLGFVDEAWFQQGELTLVSERKFSSTLAIHRPYHVQAGLYCLGLGEMGFGAAQCHYRINVFKRECHDCALLQSAACPGTIVGSTDFACDRGAYISRDFEFDRVSIIDDLNWALGFWTMEREAQPTEHTARCRSCRYRFICDAVDGPGG